MIKACIFDLDGTLCNTLDSIAYFCNQTLKQLGYSNIPTDKYRSIVGNGAEQLIHNMFHIVHPTYTPEDVHTAKQMFMDLYQENPLKCVTLYDGILPLLYTLKSNGILLAILSNKPHVLTRLSVPKLFGEHLFDIWYGQRDEIPRKPAPDGALMIAKELSVQPSQCLFIGDSDVDMHTGNSAGISQQRRTASCRCTNDCFYSVGYSKFYFSIVFPILSKLMNNHHIVITIKRHNIGIVNQFMIS